MALKTSLVISGDSASAEAALKATDAGLAKNAEQAKQLSAAYDQADRAIDRLASAQVTAKQATAQAKAAFDAGEISAKEYAGRLLETRTALSLVEGSHRSAVSALKQAQTAIGGATVSVGQARAAYLNFGRNVQDVAVQLQGGQNLGTIIAQQGPQIADAVAQMGGRFAGLASFLAGPYGAAVFIAVNAGISLAEALWSSSKAADENADALAAVKLSANSLSDIQGALGKVFDLTTGKIKDQTEATMALARASILLAQAQARQRLADANRTIGEANSPQWVFGGGAGGGLYIGRQRPIEGQVASQFQNGVINGSQAVDKLRLLQQRGRIDDATAASLAGAIANAEVETTNLKEFDKAYNSLVDGKLNGEFLKAARTKKPKKAPDLAALGEDFDRRVASIIDQFSDLPTVVERANGALRELDKITDQATKKNPPNLKVLLSDIASARSAIESSLNRPFEDYLKKASAAAQINRLLIAGREDEADALKVALDLKEKQKPLDQEQLRTVLETVRAQREQALVLRDQRALITANVRAVQDLRSSLEQTVADALRGRLSLSNVLNSFANSYINLTSQRIVERMFGDTLRSLESQATGADKVEGAGVRIAGAMDDASDAVSKLAGNLARLNGLIGAGQSGVGIVAADATVTDLASAVARNIANYGQPASNDNAAPDTTSDTQITVVANRSRSRVLAGESTANLLVGMFEAVTRDIGLKTPPLLGDILRSTLNKLEKSLPDALAGAFTGSAASRIVLGDRGLGGSIGSAVGGAVGKELGDKFATPLLSKLGSSFGKLAGPLGSVVGGLLGGVLGGLFSSKPKGSAAVTQDGVSVSANKASVTSNLNTLGGQLQSAVQQIADRLGAQVGSYDVGFGAYKDYYQVSSTGSDRYLGQTYYQNKSPNALYDGKDAQAALSAAIANAVADGAIAGISAKVAAALKSSTDIDKALSEALKVQDLELALGGVSAQLQKEFRAFEQTAKERLTLATKYGFDVVEVEKLNAKERLALSEKLLKQQVGSLQDLITELTSGSLFEGTAVDQRKAILAQIDKARADANAGVDGAADTLAKLYQQLNSVSKDVYGSTGGFAADRQAILDGAQQAIAAANQRVADAAKASDPALATTNNQLNEANDQLAKIAAALGLSVDYLKSISANTNDDGGTLAALRLAAGY